MNETKLYRNDSNGVSLLPSLHFKYKTIARDIFSRRGSEKRKYYYAILAIIWDVKGHVTSFLHIKIKLIIFEFYIILLRKYTFSFFTLETFVLRLWLFKLKKKIIRLHWYKLKINSISNCLVFYL